MSETTVGSLRFIDKDLPAPVVELDARAFGCRRDRFLAQRVAQAETGVLLYKGDRAAGYGLLIRQNDLAVLGPLVAPDDAAALAILTALMETTETAFRIGVPAWQNTIVTSLKTLGFAEDDVPPTMLRGLDRLPGKRDRYYAIAAQAFC